jgi:hypothetical protein
MNKLNSESRELQQRPRLWHSRAGRGAIHSITSGHLSLFDHQAGADKQRYRHGKAEGLGGFQIDD